MKVKVQSRFETEKYINKILTIFREKGSVTLHKLHENLLSAGNANNWQEII